MPTRPETTIIHPKALIVCLPCLMFQPLMRIKKGSIMVSSMRLFMMYACRSIILPVAWMINTAGFVTKAAACIIKAAALIIKATASVIKEANCFKKAAALVILSLGFIREEAMFFIKPAGLIIKAAGFVIQPTTLMTQFIGCNMQKAPLYTHSIHTNINLNPNQL